MIPHRSVLGPAWTVNVVDSKGLPVKGALVREELQDYSVAGTAEEHDAITDDRGEVYFPLKMTNETLLQRAEGRVASMIFVHASSGVHDYVLAFKDHASASWEEDGREMDWTGSPSTIRCTLRLKSE